MRMQHNLEQQIQARNQSGVTEEALREFSMMFKHFDKVGIPFLDLKINIFSALPYHFNMRVRVC